jgi:predicted nucleic acid-binding Zn ribbon protein
MTQALLPAKSYGARMKPQKDFAVLVNISTQKWPARQRTYFGSLNIATPTEGEAYALTPIQACRGVIDLGDKRNMEYAISAREIAEDLAREINGDSGEGSFHGVFVAEGAEPTAAELRDAREKLETFQRRLVEIADLEWERSHNPMFITDLERRAARELKLDKPWLYDPKPQAECPACGERIKSGVAVCRTCGAILDREKAARFGLGIALVKATAADIEKAGSRKG